MGQKVSLVLDDPSNEEKLKNVFKTLDKDGSGALGKKEWIKFAEEIQKNPGVYGFPPMKDKKAFIEKIFSEADTDNSGTISYEEFRAFCLAHKNKNVKTSNVVKAGGNVGNIEKGERSCDVAVIECEVVIQKHSESHLFFPGKTVDTSVRADVTGTYQAVAQKCSEGFFPAFVQGSTGGVSVKTKVQVGTTVDSEARCMKKIYMLRDTASSVPLEFTVLRVPLFLEPQKPVAQVKMSVFGRARTRVTSTEVSGAEDALPIIDEMAQQGWKMNCFDIPVENKQTHREINYADQIGKLKTSNMQFKGALDIFFTRATQNVPSPMEYAGIFTVGTVKARNEMGNSLQTYDFQVEAIQDLYRNEGWAVNGVINTGSVTSTTEIPRFGNVAHTQAEFGLLIILQRGMDTPKSPAVCKRVAESAVSVNLSGMTQGNVGVNNDDSAVDNTIIEYAKNGYKPLYAAPSGMKQGPMKLGSLPKTYILTEIGFTKL